MPQGTAGGGKTGEAGKLKRNSLAIPARLFLFCVLAIIFFS
jgi:hypothetical protein